MAAVAGRRVDHDLLASVIGQDEDTTIASLREAVGQQVLVAYETGGSEGYAFRHALMQEAAYDDLLPGERRRLHRAFAEALGGARRGGRREPLPSLGGARTPLVGDAGRSPCAWRRRSALHPHRSSPSLRRCAAHFETALDLWSSLDDPESVAGLDLASLLDQAADVASLDGQRAAVRPSARPAIAELGPGADPVQAALWQERLGRPLASRRYCRSLRAYDEAVTMVPAEPLALLVPGCCPGTASSSCSWTDGTNRAIYARRRSDRPWTGDRQVEGHALCSLGLDYSATRSDRVKGSLRSRRPTASLSRSATSTMLVARTST